MVGPARLDEGEEGEHVGRLPEQQLEPRLDVLLALGAQPVVDGAGEVLEAHVLDGAVELLEGVADRLLRVHRPHRRAQLRPRLRLEILRDFRLDF